MNNYASSPDEPVITNTALGVLLLIFAALLAYSGMFCTQKKYFFIAISFIVLVYSLSFIVSKSLKVFFISYCIRYHLFGAELTVFQLETGNLFVRVCL